MEFGFYLLKSFAYLLLSSCHFSHTGIHKRKLFLKGRGKNAPKHAIFIQKSEGRARANDGKFQLSKM